MIERVRDTPEPDDGMTDVAAKWKNPAADAEPTRKADLEIDLAAVFGEREVPLEEVLEYGVGSVIDLGSAEDVRVSVRLGPVEVARGTVVTISEDETSETASDEAEGNQEAADRRPRPRLGVRVEELSTRLREEEQND